MFGQLFNFRVKAAEKALREGRLEEAFRLASSEDIRGDRRGAAVLATLAERFLERAREHYRAERFAEALLDLDRAEVGGVLHDQIAELRQQVQTVAAEVSRQQGVRRNQLLEARRKLDANSLAAGQRALEPVSADDPEAAGLRNEIAQRTGEAQRQVASALEFLRLDRLAEAAQRVKRAASLDARNPAVLEAERQLTEAVASQAREAVLKGLLQGAEAQLRLLTGFSNLPRSIRDLQDVLDLARKAADEIRRSDWTSARRTTLRLVRLLPDASWAKEQEELVRAATDAVTALQSGPLGEFVQWSRAGASPPVAKSPPPPPGARMHETLALPGRRELADGRDVRTSSPGHLLLLVDGGGSYLLVRGAQASVGRAASAEPADIPLISDLGERTTNIVRVEDDYFLMSTREVDVNGRPTRHHLLRDGDRIVFGKRAKLNFGLPSRRSGSAVLDLSDTTKMPNDVRRVVLFSGHATIGQGPTVHIGCRHAGVPLVLFERSGSLWVRPKNDGHVAGDAIPVEPGQPVELFGVSFVVQPWTIRTGTTPGPTA
ncbi:MAG: hypothetical protein J5J06_14395 [Phycisphaerae bacterium]|nr:hypothetical protein [Phycisphaerae bacterium]